MLRLGISGTVLALGIARANPWLVGIALIIFFQERMDRDGSGVSWAAVAVLLVGLAGAWFAIMERGG